MKTGKNNGEKRNAKTYVIFTLVMLACFIGGGIIGALGVTFGENADSVDWISIISTLVIPVIIIYGVIVVGAFVFSLCCIMKIKKELYEAQKLDEDDFEDALVVIDKKMEIPLIVEGVTNIVSMTLFGLVVFFDLTLTEAGVETGATFMVPTLIILLGGLALYMAVYHIIVEKVKTLNPEKQGNVFEMNFNKHWIDSMDEAELIKVGKRSRRATQAGITTAMFLWVIGVVSMFSFNTGYLPVLFPCIMMFAIFIASSFDGKDKKKKED